MEGGDGEEVIRQEGMGRGGLRGDLVLNSSVDHGCFTELGKDWQIVAFL